MREKISFFQIPSFQFQIPILVSIQIPSFQKIWHEAYLKLSSSSFQFQIPSFQFQIPEMVKTKSTIILKTIDLYGLKSRFQIPEDRYEKKSSFQLWKLRQLLTSEPFIEVSKTDPPIYYRGDVNIPYSEKIGVTISDFQTQTF